MRIRIHNAEPKHLFSPVLVALTVFPRSDQCTLQPGSLRSQHVISVSKVTRLPSNTVKYRKTQSHIATEREQEHEYCNSTRNTTVCYGKNIGIDTKHMNISNPKQGHLKK